MKYTKEELEQIIFNYSNEKLFLSIIYSNIDDDFLNQFSINYFENTFYNLLNEYLSTELSYRIDNYAKQNIFAIIAYIKDNRQFIDENDRVNFINKWNDIIFLNNRNDCMLEQMFYYEECVKRYPNVYKEGFRLPPNISLLIRKFITYDFNVLNSLTDDSDEYIRKVKEEYTINNLYIGSINAFYDECPAMFQDIQIYEWFKIPLYVNNKRKLLRFLSGCSLDEIKDNKVLEKKLMRYHKDINQF